MDAVADDLALLRGAVRDARSEQIAGQVQAAGRVAGGSLGGRRGFLVPSLSRRDELGGIGSGEGDRHPEVGSGVMISAGAKIMGNVKIGDGVKVGAGSLVIESIPPHTTVVGVPARIVGAPLEGSPSFEMNQNLDV